MAATGAGDGGFMLRGVYEGSISGNHCEVERRPYHKNCGCALHTGSSSVITNNTKCTLNNTKVVYPIRRSWSEGNSLALFAASSSPSHSPSATTVDHFATKTKCPSFSHNLDIFPKQLNPYHS